ncbi:M15 family metallopeptidase [Pseudonocardia sp. C8]|uniref:M15 family metallopeptidase n=1 Tax=Pseudonocardia sp. C8 TaxID=2762759 RepID=UPI0016432592|nr:M15 family metallopeptidase [Pseudonocardia sp. C8]MBC3194954.1 M15 family metallopeptidase [Pseudonocardia sp. C8]
MTSPAPAPTATRATRSTVAVAVVVAIVGALGYQSWAASSSSLPHGPRADSVPAAGPEGIPRPAQDGPRQHLPPGDDDRAGDGAGGVAGGVVPGGVTVFDDEFPAVSELDPALLTALHRAAEDAAPGGVTFYVNSGWRSPEYQDQLRREATSRYGSEKEAARWVATADTSRHVSGDAVDLGGSDAVAWLSSYGAGYGLCQVYRNEPWHFELRPDAVDRGCPGMYADPTHDPRLQQ